MNAINLSYYIIKNYDGVTPLKLQKLLDHLKVWGLVSSEFSVDTQFEKWAYGPVSNEVYQQFKQYSSAVIPKSIVPQVKLPSEIKQTVNFVLDCYAVYDAITLSAMTHQEKPWKKTPVNSVISENKILKYYSKLPFAKNFPFNPYKPFYPLQTDMHYAYIFDMDKEEAISVSEYPSYIAYKKYHLHAKNGLSKVLNNLG